MLHPVTTAPIPASRTRILGVVFVLAAVLLWSTVPVGTRLLMKPGEDPAFSPAFVSAVRLWLAALVFVGIAWVYARREKQPLALFATRMRWVMLAAVGLVANYLLYAIGLQYTTASATAVISPINTIATVLLAAWLLGERLTTQKTIGMVFAICGVLFALVQGQGLAQFFAGGKLLGNVIEAVAALFWPLYAIGQTKMMQGGAMRAPLASIFLVSALLTTVCVPLTGPPVLHSPSLLDWLALIVLSLFSTVAAYWLFAAGTRRIETSEASMFNVLMPPFSLIIAALFLRETASPYVYLGLIFVLIGLACIIWRRDYSPISRRKRFALAGDQGTE